MSADAMSPGSISNIIGTESAAEAIAVLEKLRKEYAKADSSLEIAKTSDGKYRMQVKPHYLGKVAHLSVTKDFTKAVLRTLAVIAFRQPIKQSTVVKMRSNKAYEQIEELAERGFVSAERKGNTNLLTTTKKFEDYFGTTLTELGSVEMSGGKGD